jgi:hypothetical protein
MLSTRLGYGRPAFFARALAEAFWDDVKGVDFFLGFVFSQTGLDFIEETLTPHAMLMSQLHVLTSALGGPTTEDQCKRAGENTFHGHIRVCSVLVFHTRELG